MLCPKSLTAAAAAAAAILLPCRASIQFMYQKPPGLEAALIRDKELADKKHVR
jgi:hypothetical protein